MTILARLGLLLCVVVSTSAQVQAPALPGKGAAVSSKDRIYTGDQSSNTISVIDPASHKVLGTINLGSQRLLDNLNPQYVLSSNSHGLGFSRDGKHIVSLSVLTNTVNVIRTRDNKIVSTTYVERNPHEAFFAPDNRTVWVGTRGVSEVNLVDGLKGGVVGTIPTADGPSKVVFSPDGKTAYVNHIRAAEVSVINVRTRRVIDSIKGMADIFSSDFMISPDGKSLWVAHKMTGQISIVDIDRRKVIHVLDTGPETNHPNFAYINGVLHGFVTVASKDATLVYKQSSPHKAPVFVKSIRSSGVEPHGLWPSPDNKWMYIINEHSDTMDIVDVKKLSVAKTVPIGQEGQALVYVAGVNPDGDGTQGLGTQGLNKQVVNKVVPVTGPNTLRNASALITVRALSGLDMFQVIGRTLKANATYSVSASCKACHGAQIPLLSFVAKEAPNGCGTAPQVLGFFQWFGVYGLNSIKISEVAAYPSI